MIKLFTTPTNEQLMELAAIINETFKDIKKENMYVVFELSGDLLRQVDESYFFKNNKDASHSDFKHSDEVEVLVSGIKFKFIEKINEDEEG